MRSYFLQPLSFRARFLLAASHRWFSVLDEGLVPARRFRGGVALSLRLICSQPLAVHKNGVNCHFVGRASDCSERHRFPSLPCGEPPCGRGSDDLTAGPTCPVRIAKVRAPYHPHSSLRAHRKMMNVLQVKAECDTKSHAWRGECSLEGGSGSRDVRAGSGCERVHEICRWDSDEN
ncbi:hypothetical protein BU26DRAFT_141481 [Trematosphaeria pertusa]|uniref:Uncharacterized protein n=1 Tax=Trematosphaeria pertusa TaxID=390896 RepID=A0A6A6IXC7_9PLEO|nr:uncharacterized protein BU26DRAFT_141481 [Trematosphaeria pertusa]KAF2254592.1 hypothetical protein BU26DRAFT_141481 [Trematosphaeria pertusa]